MLSHYIYALRNMEQIMFEAACKNMHISGMVSLLWSVFSMLKYAFILDSILFNPSQLPFRWTFFYRDHLTGNHLNCPITFTYIKRRRPSYLLMISVDSAIITGIYVFEWSPLSTFRSIYVSHTWSSFHEGNLACTTSINYFFFEGR